MTRAAQRSETDAVVFDLGGVLVDWIVALAERQGWRAQSTSVPGVAQRTGATIYYVEAIEVPAGQNRLLATAAFLSATATSVTDPVTVVKGTKAYAGITGTLTVTVSFAELGPKTKKGSCNQSNNAQPVATYGSVSATGTV